jgi:crotonobetainyl-CoA:carnitine CoA-transferase CaiB-like acyl-CoA transferase
VSLVTLTAAQWKGLVDALIDEEDGDDLSDTSARMAGGAAIMRQVRAKVATMSTAEVVRRLAAADVPCAPVLALDELHEHPQTIAAGAIRELDHVVLGRIRQPRPAPLFAGESQPSAAWAPTLGQHTDAVLTEGGWSNGEIQQLRADGVIA